MSGFLNGFREKIIAAVDFSGGDQFKEIVSAKDQIDNLISLGVLLWEVAQADAKYLPLEETEIQEMLRTYGKIGESDLPIVLRAIREASIARIDLYTFAKEASCGLTFEAKIGILENLFRVACVDGDLAHEEHEMIRKISGLLWLSHGDFIDTKIRIKKEFGLDTAGL